MAFIGCAQRGEKGFIKQTCQMLFQDLVHKIAQKKAPESVEDLVFRCKVEEQIVVGLGRLHQ